MRDEVIIRTSLGSCQELQMNCYAMGGKFEKRGDMFSVVPTFDPVDMKDSNGNNVDIDHDLSEEDKEDLK